MTDEATMTRVLASIQSDADELPTRRESLRTAAINRVTYALTNESFPVGRLRDVVELVERIERGL